MKFNIEKEIRDCIQQPVVGNVYSVRGGSGAKHGYMCIIISITDTNVTTLTVSKDGEIMSGSTYGLHYFYDKCPIAYCRGLEELTFEVGRI
jgi:hypothetical protein